MEKLKVLFVDLDETFWKGTLSEEGIDVIEANVDLVRTLVNRGIMVCFVSKNDFESAKTKLLELGVWDISIFPKIEWSPKGPLIKQALNQMALRSENALFIDDNHLNLEEVKFHNPGISVSGPDLLKSLLDEDYAQGKSDTNLTRLYHYKILEEKSSIMDTFDSNIEFLHYSRIEVFEIKDWKAHLDRISELVERTNQLNYTKNRENVQAIVNRGLQSGIISRVYRVKDKFGDYGIVGFSQRDESQFYHFVWSCRVINLGIPEFIYARLSDVHIEIVEPVSNNLELGMEIDWLEIKEEDSGVKLHQTHQLLNEKTKIHLVGGCDLGQSMHYVNIQNVELVENFNYVANGIPIRYDHSCSIVKWINGTNEQECGFPFNAIPKIAPRGESILVFSTLMDAYQLLYKDEKTGEIFHYGSPFDTIPLGLDNDTIYKWGISKNLTSTTFTNNLVCIGQVSEVIFENNLEIICKHFRQVVIIGNSTRKIGSKDTDIQRSRELNIISRRVLSKYEGIFIDIDKILDHDMFRDNNRHYTRKGYQLLGLELSKILDSINDVSASKKTNFIATIFLELKFLWKSVKVK